MSSSTARAPRVSFEFFPPKTDKAEAGLWKAAERLARLSPAFMTVTYGAGGSTRERTHRIVCDMQARCSLPVASHLTCVNHTRDEVAGIARDYHARGIRHIVALRGDPPDGVDAAYVPTPGGYAYADDLIAGLRDLGDFEISCSAYPEVHPQAPSADFDLDHLKRKLDAGATRAITQFFFEADTFLRFMERVRAAGINAPVVPGVMPISNLERTKGFAAACGTKVPAWLDEKWAACGDDADAQKRAATEVCVQLCRDLQAGGIDQFHFYTLNRAALVEEVCRDLGLVSAAGPEQREEVA